MTETTDLSTETRSVPIGGRDITVQMLTDAQLLLLGRETKELQSGPGDATRKVKAVTRIYNILETAIVDDDDREYITDLVVERQVQMKDLMAFINAFKDEAEKKPKVRRGRPPKRS